ncbi:LuxR C-terminal-related transcriptional regulator [Brachybacterium hainanense]|uniref:LuxR C-terminal-related transcriptional regulator n=2 Tax=Brachybacterium hainanense TaxID=1541174 RepID=A0ABV6R735_9MICO
MLRQIPRIAPGAIDRPRLLARLDGPAPLVIVRGRGGTGKTTLLAQWVRSQEPEGGTAALWIDADEGTRSRTGFWMRMLGRMHAQRLIDDAELYRESASIADRPETLVATLLRVLDAQEGPVAVVLDDTAAPGRAPWWDQVCADLVEVMRRSSMLRCVAAGRCRTSLEDPAVRTVLDLDVLDDEALALEDEDVDRLIRAVAPDLPARLPRVLVRREALSGPAARRIATVRFALESLQRTPELHGLEELPRLDRLLRSAARRELQVEIPDPGLRRFLALVARAPIMDAPLAERVSGRADAPALLDRLESAGAGRWEEDAERSQAPVFRFGEHLRAEVLAQPFPGDAAQARRVHAEIALWLGTVRGEHLAAVQLALRAGDHALADTLLLRACPLGDEESAQVAELLRELPEAALHEHPMLALWHGLALHADVSAQDRAVPYLRAATALGRRAGTGPVVDAAIRDAFESTAHRLLGRHERMLELARRTLPALARIAEQPERDPELDALVLTAIDQCALGLLAAEDLDLARQARQLQLHLARRQERGPQQHDALAQLALIGVLSGDFAEAREALDRIGPEDRPPSRGTRGPGSAERIARAWILLSSGRPGEALDQLEGAGPPRESAEHWDLAVGAEAFALVMLGRGHDAEQRFHRTVQERLSVRALPATRRRLRIIGGILQISTGRAPDPPARRGSAETSSTLCALAALAELAAGDVHESVSLLGEAGLAATTLLQRMIVAAVTAVVAADPASEVDLGDAVLRMAAILRDSGAAWPVMLMPADVRDRALAVDGARDVLGTAFAAVPPLLQRPVMALRPVPRLTAREHEILVLLLETDRRAEIAERLFVSLNTVKSQLRGLYGKLDAGSRDQALSRALDLGLLQRHDHLSTRIAS